VGFGVWGFAVWGWGFGVWGVGLEFVVWVYGVGLRVWSFGCWTQDREVCGIGASGPPSLGCRVEG
jgi:hypothetical protein